MVALVYLYCACSTQAKEVLGSSAVITQVIVSVGALDTVNIIGTGFTNAGQVTGSYDGVPFTIISSNTTELVATIPFTMNTNGQLSISSPNYPTPITYTFNLSISNYTLAPGPGGVGSVLTVTGTGFPSNFSGLTVNIGGQTFSVVSSTPTYMIASNPNIAVTSIDQRPLGIGVGAETLNLGIVVTVSGISPNAGPAGTTVTISGAGFSTTPSKDTVRFNGVVATVTNATANTLTVTAPANGTTGPVSVVVGGANIEAPTVFTFPAAAQQDVSLYAGSGSSGALNGVGTAATFNSPENGVFDNQGNLYVADYGNNEIRKVTPAGNVTTFAGSTGAGFLAGQGTSAKFNAPSGLVFDPSGNLYVSDELNHAIRKIDPMGNVTTFAGSGTSGFANGIGTAASFNRPIGLAIDSITGLLYVADSRNNAIRTVDLNTQEVKTFAGTGTPGSTDVKTNALMSTFNSPRGLALYTTGSGGSEAIYLFIADYGNNKIREIVSLSGAQLVQTIGGSPANVPGSGDGNPATFSGPNSLSLGLRTGQLTLFVADASNHTIRYSANDPTAAGGSISFSTLAGTAGSPGLANGSYTQSTFHYPDGVTFNRSDGNLYVIEFGNNDIRKIILH